MMYSLIAPARLSHANFGIDSGDFLAAFLTQGIPHPTGYPTYTLLGIFFQQFPIGTPVLRGVLASLIPAAMATGLLAAWVRYVLGGSARSHVLAALSAGLAWGISPLLLSQAVIVDVHGLQSLIAMLVLWWITLNLEGKTLVRRKLNLFLSFLVGLGCGNHATILFLALPSIASLILSLKRGSSWKFVFGEIGLVLLGLCVYLYLPIRASAYPAINWGNPQTLSGFVWEVSGIPYRGLLFSVAA
ncbi:MAG: DUF2723 domain-containing protein, partial [Saprospiraceae bacterium]|nr:DUF2723 domain-containing protein [Saprospiraceae bacterium]